MKQIIKNLMKHTRHAELDSASHSVILRGAKNLNLPLTLTLSWICSTLTEFRQSCYATKGSICSLSGLVLLRPSANSLSLKGRGESVLCAIPTSKSIKVVPMSTDRATCVKHVPVPFKSSPTSTDRATCVAHDKNLSTCRLNVLKIDNTPTLSRICKFAFSSLTNSTLSQRERVKCPAFTLAETLITLGIIGVVAALTIPSLVASYRKQETVASLKKFYSTFNNAILLSEVENGDLSTWEYAPPNFADHESMKANDEFFKKYLFPYFKGIKICNARDSKCNSVMSEVLIQGTTLDLTRYIFADGACIAILSEGNLYNRSRLSGYLDINCSKKPNKPGSDQFLFHITLGEKGKEYIPFWYGIVSKRDRDTIKQMCKDDNFKCGALIQIDNWTISKDYPVKF